MFINCFSSICEIHRLQKVQQSDENPDMFFTVSWFWNANGETKMDGFSSVPLIRLQRNSTQNDVARDPNTSKYATITMNYEL